MDYDSSNKAAHRKAMTVVERVRLVNILGMLGSDHDGERAAAGLKATQMVRGKGMTWDELIISLLEPTDSTSRPSTKAGSRPAPEWRSRVAECLKQRALLNDWEREFLADLHHFRRLSSKQKAALEKIGEKVRAARGAAR